MSGTTAGAVVRLPARELQPHLAVTLRIVAPVLANLHEDEEVHGAFRDLGDSPAGRLADGLDGLAALAENDLALAVTPPDPGLPDADRPVWAPLPLVRLDSGLVGQF